MITTVIARLFRKKLFRKINYERPIGILFITKSKAHSIIHQMNFKDLQKIVILESILHDRLFERLGKID